MWYKVHVGVNINYLYKVKGNYWSISSALHGRQSGVLQTPAGYMTHHCKTWPLLTECLLQMCYVFFSFPLFFISGRFFSKRILVISFVIPFLGGGAFFRRTKYLQISKGYRYALEEPRWTKKKLKYITLPLQYFYTYDNIWFL